MRHSSLFCFCCSALAFSLGCGEPPDEPDAASVAAYFGLEDGLSRRYQAASGLEEEHEFRLVPGSAGDSLTYDRTVRRGGFIVDDLTLRLRVSTTAGLEVTRLYDCVSRCGELSAPIALLPWPLDEGRSLESQVDVTLTGAEAGESTFQEQHVVQVGASSSLEVPAGTFEAFAVIWSRQVEGGQGRSAALSFAPEVGFLRSEAFDAVTFELAEAP
ncbi:MAG: hypothetical protein ACO3JL_17245 [Myxococcota bacterium]